MRRLALAILTATTLLSAPALAQESNAARAMPVPPPPPAQEDPRYITTTGSCIRHVTPDRGLITATANYQHPNSVREASKYVMDQYEQFNAAIKAMNLTNVTIQTSDYNVNPIYQRVQTDPTKPGRQVLQGYQARLGLSVKTSSIDRLGDVIAKAGEIGIAEVGGFQLMLSDSLENKIRTECLSEAVINAKAKAAQMVTAAGARLGHLMTVSEGSTPYPIPMYRERKMVMADVADAGMAAPSVEAGANTINVTVSATFKID